MFIEEDKYGLTEVMISLNPYLVNVNIVKHDLFYESHKMSSPQAQPERIDPKEYPGGDKIEGVWHACAASGLRTVVLIPDFALSPLSEDPFPATTLLLSFAPPLVLTSVLLSVTAKVVPAKD